MKTEIEILFYDINKEELRKKLLDIGATLIKPEFLQKRLVYDFGLNKKEEEEFYSFLRIRDEKDKITLTYKKNVKDKYAQETEIIVDDFENTKKILECLGYIPNSYQENFRETYKYKNTEVTIDTWPFLNPVCEVESKTEEELCEVVNVLNLDLSKSQKENVNVLYKKTYGKWIEDLSKTDQKKITFHDKNPFMN